MKTLGTISPNIRPKRRRRLSVEVYFVLYLTAIMLLLLGTTPFTNEAYDAELEQAIAQLIDTDFSIDVEKIAMLVPFIPAGMENDSASVDLRRDTMNLIRAHGAFSRVEFKIVGIQDTASNQTLPVEKATLVPNGDSSVMFSWNQGEATRAAIYRVMVQAEAWPIIPESVSSPTLRERIQSIISQRKPMRDTAIFTINVLPFTSSEYLLAVQNPPMLNSNPNDTLNNPFLFLSGFPPNPGSGVFAVIPNENVVRVPLGSPWDVKLTIVGFPPSQVNFGLPRGVEIISQGSDHVYIGGRAERKETQLINFRALGPNGATSVVSFNISTSNLDAPRNLPEVFRRGGSYDLDFSSSGVSNSSISVRVVENGKLVQSESQTAALLSYSPTARTGKVVFTRFFDGKESDSYTREIEDIPEPVLRQIGNEGNAMILETTSYGQVKGRPNTAVLRVITGEAHEPEKVGNPQIEEATGKITQKWIVRPKNPSKKLAVTLRIWDISRSYAQGTNRTYDDSE